MTRLAARPAMTDTAKPLTRDAAIEACARAAYEADRVLRTATGDASRPAWLDLPAEERERRVLRTELLLSGGMVANADRFAAEVVRATAVQLGLGAGVSSAERVQEAPAEHDEAELTLIEDIARATAEDFTTTVKALFGRDREKRRATARSLAMLVAHDDFGCSRKSIGHAFGKRHPATVLSNVEGMRSRVESDQKLRAARARICDVLRCEEPTQADRETAVKHGPRPALGGP
jgi:hypothetical protein